MSAITAYPDTTLRNLMGQRIILETIGGVYEGDLTDFSLDAEYHLLGVSLLASSTPHIDAQKPLPCFIPGSAITGIMEVRGDGNLLSIRSP